MIKNLQNAFGIMRIQCLSAKLWQFQNHPKSTSSGVRFSKISEPCHQRSCRGTPKMEFEFGSRQRNKIATNGEGSSFVKNKQNDMSDFLNPPTDFSLLSQFVASFIVIYLSLRLLKNIQIEVDI